MSNSEIDDEEYYDDDIKKMFSLIQLNNTKNDSTDFNYIENENDLATKNYLSVSSPCISETQYDINLENEFEMFLDMINRNRNKDIDKEYEHERERDEDDLFMSVISNNIGTNNTKYIFDPTENTENLIDMLKDEEAKYNELRSNMHITIEKQMPPESKSIVQHSKLPSELKGKLFRIELTQKFNNYLEFINYTYEEIITMLYDIYRTEYMSYQNNKLCMHEIIGENSKQKLYIDIDIDLNKYPYQSIEPVVSTMTRILTCTFPDIQLLYFSSSSSEKISLHIIGVNIYFNSCKEQLRLIVFLKKVYNLEYIDILYKKNQSFRLPYCHKFNSNRFKLLYKYKTNNPSNLNFIDIPPNIMINGIVQYFGIEAKHYSKMMIPTLIPEFTKFKIKDKRISTDNNCNINNPTGDILELLRNIENTQTDCYEITKIEKNFITLARIAPSFCAICNRMHEHENKFAIKLPDGYTIGCHRNYNVKINIKNNKASISVKGVNKSPHIHSNLDNNQIQSQSSPVYTQNNSAPQSLINLNNETFSITKINNTPHNLIITNDKLIPQNICCI